MLNVLKIALKVNEKWDRSDLKEYALLNIEIQMVTVS